MAEEGIPNGERRVGHLPGDQVRVEIGFFRHEMNLKEVFAAFEHEESHEPFEVTLRGRPEEAEPPSGGMKFSRAVKQALAEAFKKIREIEDAATTAGDHTASATLGTIGGRVTNAANAERKFGLALADLLQRVGLPDAAVVDEYLKSNPRPDGREHWVDIVSHYRTDVIHYGHLHLGSEGEGWRDVWTIINHLHDVMARILLQTLGYDGGYQPAVVTRPSIPYEVDWVKPDTSARALGYSASAI
jgi:hypothetical protein